MAAKICTTDSFGHVLMFARFVIHGGFCEEKTKLNTWKQA